MKKEKKKIKTIYKMILNIQTFLNETLLRNAKLPKLIVIIVNL